jgi:hypothetical protein
MDPIPKEILRCVSVHHRPGANYASRFSLDVPATAGFHAENELHPLPEKDHLKVDNDSLNPYHVHEFKVLALSEKHC